MLHFFFFNDTATTEIYTLSLHDALPISGDGARGRGSSGESARVSTGAVARRPGPIDCAAARSATRAEADVSGAGAAATGEEALGCAHVSPRAARCRTGGVGARAADPAHLHALFRREHHDSCGAGRNPDSLAHVDGQRRTSAENSR